jgi:hypothetical protein
MYFHLAFKVGRVIEDEIIQKRREPYAPSLLPHALSN